MGDVGRRRRTYGLSSETLDENPGISVDEKVLEGIVVVGRGLGGRERPSESYTKTRKGKQKSALVPPRSLLELSFRSVVSTSFACNRVERGFIRGGYDVEKGTNQTLKPRREWNEAFWEEVVREKGEREGRGGEREAEGLRRYRFLKPRKTSTSLSGKETVRNRGDHTHGYSLEMIQEKEGFLLVKKRPQRERDDLEVESTFFLLGNTSERQK